MIPEQNLKQYSLRDEHLNAYFK